MSDITVNPYSAPNSDLATTAPQDLYAAAIGPENTDYYLRFLQKADGRNWVIALNWPAFLFTSAWLLYRKMWLGYVAYVGVPLGIGLMVAIIGMFTGTDAALIVAIAQFVAVVLQLVAFPIYANAIYQRKLTHLVNKAARISTHREVQRQWLAKKGGVTWAVLLVLFAIGLILLIASIALPAYQEYIQASRAARSAS